MMAFYKLIIVEKIILLKQIYLMYFNKNTSSFIGKIASFSSAKCFLVF